MNLSYNKVISLNHVDWLNIICLYPDNIQTNINTVGGLIKHSLHIKSSALALALNARYRCHALC